MSLREDVIDNVTRYLKDADAEMIGVLADRAIAAYSEYRNYPAHWTADQILADQTRHTSCICDLALYECIQQGAEFQSMHIESGLYRMWNNKGNIYTNHGIVPFATL